MRPLTEEELGIFNKKLLEFISESSLKLLTENQDDPYVFRIIDLRVYYMSEMIAKLAGNVGREELCQFIYYY
jgi:60S ribosome subunit biogenesis protein NIP7